jgi:FkbM family methyltransferase
MFNKNLFDTNDNVSHDTRKNWVKKKIDSFNMYLDPSDGGISLSLYYSGARELAFMSILQNTVAPGMTCLDLGGNIGYTTLFMCRNVGNTGTVYAVEPDPKNIELLRANITKNGYDDICEITQCAISDKNKKLEFWQADKPNLSSVHKTKHSNNKIEVDALDLVTYFKDRKFPNFIKMDVEGHEVSIFHGGLKYFTDNKDQPVSILLEVHPHFYGPDNDFEKILKKYFKIGFDARFVVATPIPQPRLFKEAGYTPLADIHTDGFHRGIYENIKNEDLLRFACHANVEGTSKKIVRSFMLQRR